MDGKPGPDFNSDTFLEDDPVFSPNGARLAYGVRTNDQEMSIVLDGRVTAAGKNAALATGIPRFSPDSKRFLWALEDRLFLDGEFGPKFDRLTSAGVFSPDGKHVAYGAARGGEALMPASSSWTERCAQRLAMSLAVSFSALTGRGLLIRPLAVQVSVSW